MNFSNDTIKAIQEDPAKATPEQIKALAFLWPNAMDIVMLRNQQIRLYRDRLKDALERSLASQQRATRYSRQLLFWMLMTLVFASGLIGSWAIRWFQ